MYVVIGASGHTGSTVAEKLLSQGEQVRVVGRDPAKLESFKQRGAEVFVGEVTDAGAMAKAFAGADAAYVMIPPNPGAPNVPAFQQQVMESLASAVDKNHVEQVVALSSVGADKADKTGPVVGLHNLERRFESISGLNVVFLRAGYFMENILPQVSVIQAFGSMAGPVRADLPLPMIATLTGPCAHLPLNKHRHHRTTRT